MRQTIANDDMLSRGMKEGDIVRAWEDSAGEAIARYTSKIYIRDGKLFVQFSSASAKSAFYQRRYEIIDALNRAAGEKYIKFITVL